MVKKRTKLARQRRKERRRKETLDNEQAFEQAEEFEEELDALVDMTDEDWDEYDEEFDDEEPSDEDLEEIEDEDDDDEEEFVPKSFEELNEIRKHENLWEKKTLLSKDAQDIISNIINDPVMDMEEKATGIGAVAKEMKSLWDSFIGKAEEEFDYDVVSLEILAKEATLLDQTKAVLSGATRSGLSDSSFALIYEGKNGKKVRKYPIHYKAHLINSLARAAQMIKRGGQAASDARKALPKIRAAAKKMGIGQPSKKNANGFVIEKDTNGDYRWVGWATNNRGPDKDGDFLTDAAHKEFIQFLEDNPDWYIEFYPWHQKQFAFTHPADATMYKNGFMIYSGKLEEEEAIRLMNVARKEKLGMSHGFIPLERKEKHIYNKYRTFEVSVLPLHAAANPYTSLEVIAKESGIMKKEDYLRELLGEDRFNQLEKDTEFFNELLDEQGVEAKEVKDEKKEEPEEVLSDEQKQTIEMIKNELGMNQLDEAFNGIVETLSTQGSLLKSVIEKMAEMEQKSETDLEDELAKRIQAPISKKFSWQEKDSNSKRPSERDDNIVKDEEVEKAGPKPSKDWMNTATGTHAIPEEEVEAHFANS